MNDCIWGFTQVCQAEGCRCKNYLSVNTEGGYEILKKYDQEVTVTLEAMRARFRAEYLEKKED